MRITEVRFRGLKSLLDVTCTLDQLTVITGPNGAGKSNFVDAINLLSECFEFDLEIAVARAGGYANIAYRGKVSDTQPVTFFVALEIDSREILDIRHIGNRRDLTKPISTTFYITYEFTINAESADASDFSISSEHLRLRDKEAQLLRFDRAGDLLTFRRSKRMTNRGSNYGNLLYPLSDSAFLRFVKNRVSPTRLTLSVLQFGGGGLFELVSRQLSDARVFQLSPHQCRLPGVSTPNARLDRHGQNLPAVADYLRRQQPSSWELIEHAMRAIIPQLESIETTFTNDRQLALQFREQDLPRPWNSNEMSDGTIQMLALFIALFDQRLPMLVVEEPENALHPWILRHFLEMCREQSYKQIVLTTHSPILLDAMSPENIRLLWSTAGQSRMAHVSDLKPSIIEMWKSGDLRTFEIYDSGIIPEYLPGSFTPEDEER
ncbi:AAA family ATPase [Nocardia bovistercoris]|uniref:AAA family ATPase n=1 Tax=Nocardia bovistercoris TaxID=2785916 RepID=A0A931N613_9NOCA|nr:AAA family ATPase [Nocardia bovistercoris]